MRHKDISTIFALDMKTLLQLLKDFDGTKATSVDDLTGQFKEIATRVLFGGHFEINDMTEIFPTDIEFYYFNENPNAPVELNDSRMYHKGKNLDYFPIFSFYPNESGVDVTFEHEDKKFRASFLIRSYRYKYCNPDTEGLVTNPRYLWEDMFGYHSIGENGISIKWVDESDFNADDLSPIKRHHLNTEKGNQIVPDEKLWRFKR